MTQKRLDSLNSRRTLEVAGQTYHYYSLDAASEQLGDISNLPNSLKVLLENLLRHEDNQTISRADFQAFVTWLDQRQSKREIAYRPARVLLQDLTGVPAVVDLAALRHASAVLGSDPKRINPLCPVDLVVDHSVQVDKFGSNHSFAENVTIEMKRNLERYQFLRWGQQAFDNFRVVPPGTGICHQVNLEYLGRCVFSCDIDGEQFAYPDTLVGTDSHTTMINALGILGWGVGGIEAEAAMLGQPVSMLIPEVVGVKLTGRLPEGATATDLVLMVTEMLRQHGVVGKFVEYYGDGLDHLSLPDRATLANMAPEYGATCGFFPIDQTTLDYLQLSGRDSQQIALVEAYATAQGLWRASGADDERAFSSTLHLDLNTVQPSIAGPKRPQDRVVLSDAPAAFNKACENYCSAADKDKSVTLDNGATLEHGSVVITAITSCTNTSNPDVMIAAGLVAKKAVERGLKTQPWVKSSLAPGSKVVSDYLEKTHLQSYLDQLGFNLVGYGCTTCIGNSGPLDEPIAKAITDNDLAVCAVLSGNRNFEGRIHPLVKANWLASPPLVVAYALAGSLKKDLTRDPLGEDSEGKPVYLKEIWPSSDEIAVERAKIDEDMFRRQYADVFDGNEAWNEINAGDSETYNWEADSTYIRLPPFFEALGHQPPAQQDIHDAHILALLGDSVTTDHISPAGAIKLDSPAGKYLTDNGVAATDFNTYGTRRGNHEVMMRGTFANIRIRNEMLEGVEGGMTRHLPSDTIMPIYDAAMLYQQAETPLVVIAGKEYGTGSSRDWAAKGTLLLGVKAVIAESFERIHRSNLIGMGVLPLQFTEGVSRKTLQLDGSETINIIGLTGEMAPAMSFKAAIQRNNGNSEEITLLCRIDTGNELTYYHNQGILHYVLRNMIKQ
ncbi:MAG: aconitate hydratase AcnA [Gammaproteobacteria bacterium]|nr:aconitate hydratase AcnA [Gammaproteobacteria bacterium]